MSCEKNYNKVTGCAKNSALATISIKKNTKIKKFKTFKLVFKVEN